MTPTRRSTCGRLRTTFPPPQGASGGAPDVSHDLRPACFQPYACMHFETLNRACAFDPRLRAPPSRPHQKFRVSVTGKFVFLRERHGQFFFWRERHGQSFFSRELHGQILRTHQKKKIARERQVLRTWVTCPTDLTSKPLNLQFQAAPTGNGGRDSRAAQHVCGCPSTFRKV